MIISGIDIMYFTVYLILVECFSWIWTFIFYLILNSHIFNISFILKLWSRSGCIWTEQVFWKWWLLIVLPRTALLALTPRLIWNQFFSLVDKLFNHLVLVLSLCHFTAGFWWTWATVIICLLIHLVLLDLILILFIICSTICRHLVGVRQWVPVKRVDEAEDLAIFALTHLVEVVMCLLGVSILVEEDILISVATTGVGMW